MSALLGLSPLRDVLSVHTGLDSGVWPRKYPAPPTTPFAKLWKPLFLMLRVLFNVMVKHRDTPDHCGEVFQCCGGHECR